MSKASEGSTPGLRSAAWLLRGISSLPGELVVAGDLVSFKALNTGSAWPWQLRRLEREVAAAGIEKALGEGRPAEIFAWPIAEVRAWCPWYYFGGGIKLGRGSAVMSLSFGTPGNMRVPSSRLDPFAAFKSVAGTPGEVRAMRSLGAQWRAALTGSDRMPPRTG